MPDFDRPILEFSSWLSFLVLLRCFIIGFSLENMAFESNWYRNLVFLSLLCNIDKFKTLIDTVQTYKLEAGIK